MPGVLHNVWLHGRERNVTAWRNRENGETSPKEDAAAILVVEDEVLLRMLIADALRSAGFTVLEASNSQEALDALRHGCGVNLVFSDIQMPGPMDGERLARLVRSEYPLVKIVLTSGQAAVDGTEHDGFFPKPYNAAKIVEHVKTLLGLSEPASGRK